MNQTIWITNTGEMLNLSPNQHYSYIRDNFQRLFGKTPLNEGEVHDAPYTYGWVHIQNHFGVFNVRGNPQAISSKKSMIRNLIFERLMSDREFVVNIEYNNKAMINQFGTSYSFKMPDQYNDLASII